MPPNRPSQIRKESNENSSSSNHSKHFLNTTSTDIPSTSKSIDADRNTQLPDIPNDPRDIFLNNYFGIPTFINHRPLTLLGKEDRDEKLLAYFFLKNMDPTDADLNFLCEMTNMGKQDVKSWFVEKRNLNLGRCGLEKNQYPLALVYFKSKPKPSLDEIAMLSTILQTDKLRIARWFNTRRKTLKRLCLV